MRLTQTLYRQHIGRMFKRHWIIQGQRVPIETGAADYLSSIGIPVVEATDFIKEKHTKLDIKIVGVFPKPLPQNENHPLWKNKTCHTYGDSNVLIGGIPQAQILTKTLTIDSLPRKVEDTIAKITLPSELNKSMQNAILAAHVFDTQQEKTAKVKVPDRPAFVLPRNYGITDSRKNRLIIAKLIQHSERLAGQNLTSHRQILSNAYFSVPFEKDGDLFKMGLHAETMIASETPIQPCSELINSKEIDLPDIFPLKYNISMPTTQIYDLENIFPIVRTSKFSNPHTIFLHYSPLDVKNLHETPITDSQYKSRGLLKAFAVAASKAKSKFGADVKNLPRPIVVQAVQTNGKSFYFGVFQLNTLNLNGTDDVKNYWFSTQSMDLYEDCSYKVGKPTLEGYNKNVLHYVCAFYNQ